MAAKKMKKGLMHPLGFCTHCCGSWNGLFHVVPGIGLGYLIVYYFGLTNLLMWGWILVGVGFVGHLWGKTHCDMHK